MEKEPLPVRTLTNQSEEEERKKSQNKLFIELIDFLHDSIFFSLFCLEL